MGIDTDNTEKWLTEWRRVPDLAAKRQRLAATMTAHVGAGPAATQRLRQQVAELDAQITARSPQPGQLIIVDEASLAGTLALDEVVTAANQAGAKVLLVGDPDQLSSVQAGGAFGLLVADRGDLAPQLRDVQRFSHPWESTASLDLRAGRPEALAAYETNDRVIGGPRDALLEAVYHAWKSDVDAGKSSLMIAADTATVARLSARTRADRITIGAVDPGGVDIADGQVAGVGDLVVTRRNDRRLLAGRRWIKNGHRWQVTAAHPDGRLTVRRLDEPAQVTLPARYVHQHVELAYATTAHQAQGRTVDTAHALVSQSTTREVLYVAATRGRDSNRLYVDTKWDPDPATGRDELTPPRGPRQILENVLANEGRELSAHETRQEPNHAVTPAFSSAIGLTTSPTPASGAAPDL